MPDLLQKLLWLLLGVVLLALAYSYVVLPMLGLAEVPLAVLVLVRVIFGLLIIGLIIKIFGNPFAS